MLIIALVLALIGLAALVFAVVTSNELVAWVCIVASVIGVVLLIIDAVRERRVRAAGDDEEVQEDQADQGGGDEDAYDYPEELSDEGDDETVAEPSRASDASEESAIGGDERAK